MTESRKAQRKRYYEAHKEELKEKAKIWGKENLEKRRAGNAKWRKANPEKTKGYLREYRKSPRDRFSKLKNRAKAAGMAIEMTQSEFLEWYDSQKHTCHYCKRILVTTNGLPRKPNTLTIDRKDNNLTYSLENMVICCDKCNMIKGPWFTEYQMLEIAETYLIEKVFNE